MNELFRSKRTRLTPLVESDAVIMAPWFADAQFLRLYDGAAAKPKTATELQKVILGWRDSGKQFMFALRALDDERLLGFGGLDDVNWRNGVGWLAMAIAPDVWDQGYGGELLGLILRYAFDELDLHRVQLTVFAYNERAIALYKGRGLRQEGCFREAIYRDGARHDMLLMGLLQSEWRAL